MYALVTVWDVEKGREEEQQRGLEQKVVPLVQRAPGFVTAYWTSDPTTGKSYTMIVFDSEEAARQFMAVAEGDPNRRGEVGISLELMAVAKVIAHAVAA